MTGKLVLAIGGAGVGVLGYSPCEHFHTAAGAPSQHGSWLVSNSKVEAAMLPDLISEGTNCHLNLDLLTQCQF